MRRPILEPSAQVFGQRIEITSRTPETDVSVGPNEVLRGLLNVAHPESRKGIAHVVDESARDRASRKVMHDDQGGPAGRWRQEAVASCQG